MTTDLKSLQQSFMAHLASNDTGIESDICQQGSVSIQDRLAIYGHAYRTRLKETLQTDHPILEKYLGCEQFNHMSTAYTNGYPSNTHSLRHFADHLPTFLAENEPFQQSLILSELARFERRLLDSFDAANATAIPVTALSKIPAAQWPIMHIRFHPSLQLFKSEWGAVRCWQALKTEKTPPEQANASLEHWVLWRNQKQITEFKCVSPLEYQLLSQALLGQNFSSICDAILLHLPENEAVNFAVNTLKSWLNSHWITQLVTDH